jgi:uncharacterized membrane protein YgcG
LFFIFNEDSREALENEFEDERLHEVNELLVEGRHETIQFAGLWMVVNGEYYVSGIRVMILESTQLPTETLENDMAVVITGHTNADGFVEAESIEMLPQGTVVPVGEPVEIESEDENNNEASFEDSNENNVIEDSNDPNGENSNEYNNVDNNSGDDSGSNDGGDNGSDDHNGSDDGGDDGGGGGDGGED